MNRVRSLLTAQTRIVDRGTSQWCSAYSGRCTSTQDYYAGIDPASKIGESASFIAAVANQARRMLRPGIRPAIGDYAGVRAYLIRAVSAAMKRDAASGESIDLVVVTKEGFRRIPKEDVKKMLA